MTQAARISFSGKSAALFRRRWGIPAVTLSRFAWVFLASITIAAAIQENPRYYIREYRVLGAKHLKTLEVEKAVYPFLGPGRTVNDVEQARQALEKAYHDQGFPTVSVSIPQQDPRRGIIRLEVTEAKVARLRVNGARWFLPSRIKEEVPSVAEGSVPNINRVRNEMIAVNRLADRRVTPQLLPGEEPGTVDINLNVEDKMPLHGSLELNNRYSANTTPLRLNGAISYSNLFQLGHTLGVNFQIAPENIADAQVYSAYYLARVSDGLSLMLQGTKQDSNVSTLGGAAVNGKGNIIGLRALIDLPNLDKFYQSFNFGIDYKNFSQDITIAGNTISTPFNYFPISANYSASWLGEKSYTEANTSLNLNLRGTGSSPSEYNSKRYDSSGNFIYLKADAARTQDIKYGAQVYGKLQGQMASGPLVNSEQIAGGGLGNVRGYLEATGLGDNGAFGTVELRSPSLIGTGKPPSNSAKGTNEWRFYAFTDAGLLTTYDTLPGQQSSFWFSSVGFGTRFQAYSHYHGSVDAAVPLNSQSDTRAGEVRLTFRGWADF
jgi:hemolysin activation/secretion protein